MHQYLIPTQTLIKFKDKSNKDLLAEYLNRIKLPIVDDFELDKIQRMEGKITKYESTNLRPYWNPIIKLPT